MPDDEGQTALMVAAESQDSNVETMQLLLDRGANPNFFASQYPTPVLLCAVSSGDIERVRCLLMAGADVNLVVGNRLDALTCAANQEPYLSSDRSLSMVELLLEYGASVHFETDGQTALSSAFDEGNFEVVKRLLEAGADESQLQWNSLVKAIVIGTVEDVRQQLKSGADLLFESAWDDRTPWLNAVLGGNIEKANLLLKWGANLDDTGFMGKTALFYAVDTNDSAMLKWLLSVGCDVDATDEYGKTALMEAIERKSVELAQSLLEAGADPNKISKHSDTALKEAASVNSLPLVELLLKNGAKANRPGRGLNQPIHATTSVEVMRLLLEAGQDLSNVNADLRAQLIDIENTGSLVPSREDFEEGRGHRFGTANPEKMDIAFWRTMVRNGAAAQYRRSLFVPKDEWFRPEDTPIWCHDRFVMSLTELPDGRFIEIGGYHEQLGDHDFYIYNDVIVYRPGDGFDIYGYPIEVFPPTDGHSATLVGNWIYIIGSIGYHDKRIAGYTPVYRLNVQTFAIEKIETSGDNPGWIFNHRAVLVGNELHISGGEVHLGDEDKSSYPLANMSDYSSAEELNQAFYDYFLQEPPQRAERFALDLTTHHWRRIDE